MPNASHREQGAYPDLASLFEPYVWAWFQDTFEGPSPPQIASWPKIAEGKNTLIFSPTGSGKTLASFLWCINHLFKAGCQQALEDAVYVLYVSPLKALNNDIQKNLIAPLQGIKKYARRAGVEVPDVRSLVRTGDTTASQRAAMARKPPHILITTPESLYIILATLKFRDAFRTVRYVIVDEIHAISNNKRGVHLSLSLERLQHLVTCSGGRELVRIGLSATQKPLDEIAKFLVGMEPFPLSRGPYRRGAPTADGRQGEGLLSRPCEIVDVGARKNLNVRVLSPVDNLLEAQFDAIWGSSYDKMLSLIREHETTLIFSNSRYKTERTALRLNELSAETSGGGDRGPVTVGAHHGSMSKEVRLGMENKLKRGELDALVATASLELGIDVGSIDLVCQIQSPKSVSTGMQRIGRAGHLLHATSEGRLLVTDRDDLVESAVLVRAIMEGQIDTTRIPTNCLDVLAQQIVGAVAADDWHADDLYDLFRRSYCYRDLDREEYDRVLDLLSGNYTFDVEYPPYPKIIWDKVNNHLYPERGARLIAFRASGTIPDVADYDVYFESKQTRVGRLDEGFVEQLHAGDIFILGSSSWQVTGIRRNRVFVEDVYGRAPTIPFWGGDRDSRTYDLGLLVGQFRAAMDSRLPPGQVPSLENAGGMSDRSRIPVRRRQGGQNPIHWLQREYHVDENGAKAIYEYCREQKLVAGELPSHKLILVEHFTDELGLQQIVIHSSAGIRVHDPWAMALQRAIEAQYGFQPQTATMDDGILITVPQDRALDVQNLRLLDLVNPENLDQVIEQAVLWSPVFLSRFRHNAVRSLLVLREYRGRRTPVWLQSLRANALLEACQEDRDNPLIAETYRECTHESLDVPNLRRVLEGLASGEIQVKTIETEIPSPFAHSLLLLGQYGDVGSIPTRERRSRLMHLHRELLKQILDEETLRNLLDVEAVQEVEDRLQRRDAHRQARNANELARVLLELGDLVDGPDEQLSLLDRTAGDAGAMLAELASAHRAVRVTLPTLETDRQRWISTEQFPLYRDAFAMPPWTATARLDDVDRRLVEILEEKGPLALSELLEWTGSGRAVVEEHLERLVNGYHVLRLDGYRDEGSTDAAHEPAAREATFVAARAWIPDHILGQRLTRETARQTLVQQFLRQHGPVTKYEVMERYGFPSPLVERILDALHREGSIARGEYVPYKAFPQWCYKSNLEQIHRLTLNRLRKEMEPATPAEYADLLIRWQGVHPETQLSGLEGLRETIERLQGQETYQIVYERDILPTRVQDYTPSMLDRLCYGGEVFWRRFDHKTVRRGQIGFCLRRDLDWLVADPTQAKMHLNQWDDDIPEACNAVRGYLRDKGACFFDDIVRGTGLDWRLVLRAIWHLVWTGEATNDSYESIRHAAVASGLSACYDLGTRPGRKGVTLDFIVGHMLELRKLDPRLGRWAPTERLVPSSIEPPEREQAALAWAHLLLKRYGIVCRETFRREICPLPWKDLRRALVRLELLGKVRRGFHVQDLSGEQYAYPEAMEALREAKLRHPDQNGDENGRGGGNGRGGVIPPTAPPPGEPMILLNVCDPANPFGAFFTATTQSGEDVKFMRVPQKYLVMQYGRPLLLYEGDVKLLVDLPKERAAEAIVALMQLVDRPAPVNPHQELPIRGWNGHPIDVSPARHLLTMLGFVPVDNRWKGYIYDGLHRATPPEIEQAERQIPDLLEHWGKEAAPVKYDAEWIVSRSHADIRDKVRELIGFLERTLPPQCEIVYQPRQFQVRYRGFRCMNPYIQRKQIYLQITHKGWTRGIQIQPDTDLDSPAFVAQVQGRLDKVRGQIDELIESRRRS
jgi:ATP-dependent Lhr-like helicase